MPDQSSTIGVGGDYPNINSWLSDADVSDGFWRGVIIDNNLTTGSIVIDSVIGTPDVNNYIHLTTDPSVRHNGFSGTNNILTSVNGHVITVSVSFTRLDYLDIRVDSPSNSHEGIRILSGTNDILISKCLIHADSNINDQDGVYIGNYPIARLNIDNCIIYGFGRAGVNLQNFNGTSDQSVTINSCTITDNGRASETGSGAINLRVASSGSTLNLQVHNCALFNTQGGFDNINRLNVSAGTTTLTGSNSISDDTSLSASGIGSGSVENVTLSGGAQVGGSHFIVNDLSSIANYDLRLLNDDTNNEAIDSGLVIPIHDVRQDFTIDISGNSRTDIDIGASEFVTVAVDFTIISDVVEDADIVSGSVNNPISITSNVIENLDVVTANLFSVNQIAGNVDEDVDAVVTNLFSVNQIASNVDEDVDTVATNLFSVSQITGNTFESLDTVTTDFTIIVNITSTVLEFADNATSNVDFLQNFNANITESVDTVNASLQVVTDGLQASILELSDDVGVDLVNIMTIIPLVVESLDSVSADLNVTVNVDISIDESADVTNVNFGSLSAIEANVIESTDNVSFDVMPVNSVNFNVTEMVDLTSANLTSLDGINGDIFELQDLTTTTINVLIEIVADVNELEDDTMFGDSNMLHYDFGYTMPLNRLHYTVGGE